MRPESQRNGAYHCIVPIELSRAQLSTWFRRIPVEVLSVSRDEFTIVIKGNQSNHFHVGKKFRMRYRGEANVIQCLAMDSYDEARLVVVVRRLCDITRIPNNSGSWWLQFVKSSQGADPVIAFGLTVGFVMLVLVSPGWGEDLGTSVPISNLVRHCYEVFVTALVE